MHQFTFMFRQGKRILLPEEQKQRASEVREWALAQVREGRKLDPHILGDGGYQIASTGEAVPTQPAADGSVIAIVFLEATDLDGAVAIAKTHPGLHYGSSIEVREWSPPPNLSTADSTRR